MNIYPKAFIAGVLLAAITAVGLLIWQNMNPGFRNDSLYSGISDGSLEDYFHLSTKNQADNSGMTTDVTFNAVGDIMLSRGVASKMKQNGQDGFWPFRGLENELRWDADFNFGNLESPFSGTDEFDPWQGFKFNSPTWALSGLAQYNFKVLNLANNHILNQGVAGVYHTIGLLEDNKLTPIGAGEDLDEAWQGGVFSIKGIRVGFVGASYAPGGQNVAHIKDTARLAQSIDELKTRADFIVVTMHAGEEYVREPNQSQTDFAHAAIDAGADMVIGSHPHWIQPYEKYQGKYIFYSLGNFVFDQMWSQDTREGLMLKITLSKPGLCHPGLHPNSPTPLSRSDQINLVCTTELQGTPKPVSLKQVELIPVIIEDYGQPRKANAEEKQSILNKIGATTNVITP